MATRPDPDRYTEQARDMLNDLEDLGEKHADFVDRTEEIVGNILDQSNERRELSIKQADLLDNIKNQIEEKTRSVF